MYSGKCLQQKVGAGASVYIISPIRDFIPLSTPSFTVELEDEEMGPFFPTSKSRPFPAFLALQVLMGETATCSQVAAKRANTVGLLLV